MPKRFDESINKTLGLGAIEADFDPEDLTPEFQPYDLEFDFGVDNANELTSKEVTPETGDNYLNAEISLPRGGTMAMGRVIGRKRDTDGNPIGRANSNPILDTRAYKVQFDDGDVTKLTASMIAQFMYAQCDADGNQTCCWTSCRIIGRMTLPFHLPIRPYTTTTVGLTNERRPLAGRSTVSG